MSRASSIRFQQKLGGYGNFELETPESNENMPIGVNIDTYRLEYLVLCP
jgi:hypothetical protein